MKAATSARWVKSFKVSYGDNVSTLQDYKEDGVTKVSTKCTASACQRTNLA